MFFPSNDLLELTDLLKLNNISKDKICLVGSSTLSLIGIRDQDDIDIIIHSECNQSLKGDYKCIERVKNPWSTLFSDDEIIKDPSLHILYSGYKFVIPELVYHKKIWHNRIKDKDDISQLYEYSKAHSEWDWGIIKHNLPTTSIIKRFLARFYDKYLHYKGILSNLSNYINLNDINSVYNVVPTNYLLSQQVLENSFIRYDVVVRYMAITSFYDKNDLISLYNKMQEKRKGSRFSNPWKFFKKLIVNIEREGLEHDQPILVNQDLHIVDGAHRLACALYFKEPFISVKINKGFLPSPFSLEWFRINGFTEKELDLIENRKLDLFLSNHLYFEIVLWPPVFDFFDDIERLISKEYSIIEKNDYSNMKNFNEYVRNLYKIDDIKRWKVDIKINYMNTYAKNIRVIKINIPEPDFRKKSNGKYISRRVEDLKYKIRKEYSKKIDNYFYDVIVHIGDNYIHSSKTTNLL